MSRKLAALLGGVLAIGAVVFVVTRDSSEPRAAKPAVPVASRPADRVAHERARLDHIAGQPGAADQLRAAFDATTDRAERVRLIEAATKIPDEKGLALLVGIASTDDELAAQAGAAIGQIAHPRLADELAKLATSDGSVLVRANAARALARSGSKANAATLAALVADAFAPIRVRQEAALALAKVGDDSAAVTLGRTLDELANDLGAEQLRLSIVQALGGIATPAAREALARHQARKLSTTELAFVLRALANNA